MTSPEAKTDTWVPELTFAARLALVRHRMGWNIKEAALACGEKPQSWRGWELEGRLPHDQLTVADNITRATGVNRNWLLFGGPLAADDRRPVRLTRPKRRKAQPTAHYPIGADHGTCVPARSTTPSPVRPASPLNHTAATHTPSRPGRRTRRIDRSSHGE